MTRTASMAAVDVRQSGVLAIGVVVAMVLGLAASRPAYATDHEVRDISAGEGFSCAVADDGGVWCWGYNQYGNLGDGSTTPNEEPVQVMKLGGGFVTDAIQVDAGEAHGCAVTGSGTVWCWGVNDFGQLGDGTKTERHGAVQMTSSGGAAITTAKSVSAGDFNTCVRTSTKTALCAGFGTGDGTQKSRTRAVSVRKGNGKKLTGVTQVSADNHVCARTTNREAWCWGDNELGALGDGTKKNKWHAVRVKKSGGGRLTKVTDVDAGELHSCARRAGGSAWCWGYNAWRALGDGTGKDRTRAVRVKKKGGGFLKGVKDVDAGQLHSCARTKQAVLYCWGNNERGSLGDGSLRDQSKAAKRVLTGGGTLTGVRQLSAGGQQSCARTSDGTAWCWGLNEDGQVGDGTKTNRKRAVEVVRNWEAP